MSEVEQLLDASRNSISACFIKFTLATDKMGTGAVYFFIEGRDAPYYHPRIKESTQLSLVPINCGGKKNVLGIFSRLLTPEYKKYKKCFFVDADYDDNSSIPNDVFVTPCYSIENLYVTKHVLCDILQCEFGIAQCDDMFNCIVDLFLKEITIFNNCILDFNAWYSTVKNYHKMDTINLDEKFPKEFICLSIKNIIKKYTLEDIKKKFRSCDVCESEFLKEKEKIMNSDGKMLRGKYLKQFFIAFLNFLIDDANCKEKNRYCKSKTHFIIDSSQFLSQISQYAETPTELVSYIRRQLEA